MNRSLLAKRAAEDGLFTLRPMADSANVCPFADCDWCRGVAINGDQAFQHCDRLRPIEETAMTIHRWFDDYVFEVSGFLPADRCDELIAQAERQQFEGATVSTAGGHRRRENLRNNDRVISDDGKLSAELWASAAIHVPRTFKGRVASGLNERLRFYRYDPGQKFDWHQDGYYERENGERSQFTFMVYLNDGFGGGGTSFVDPYGRLFDPFTVAPRKGSALFFYHHLDHRGDEVTSGRKYVLRSDVMYAPPGET